MTVERLLTLIFKNEEEEIYKHNNINKYKKSVIKRNHAKTRRERVNYITNKQLWSRSGRT